MKRVMATVLAKQGMASPLGANQDVRGISAQALMHLDCVYTVAVWISGDTCEAEELLQETYRQAVRSFHGLQSATNYKVWLLSRLRHIYLDRYQQKEQGAAEIAWDKLNQAYKALIEEGENAAELFSQLSDLEIATILKKLPEEYRTAIVLVDIHKLSHEEATAVIECPVGAIRSRLSWGRRMLQVALWNYVRARGRNTVSPLLKVWVTVRTRFARPTVSLLIGLLTFPFCQKH